MFTLGIFLAAFAAGRHGFTSPAAWIGLVGVMLVCYSYHIATVA